LLAQLPVGWLADHVDSRKLLTSGAIITLLALALMPFSVAHEWLMWLVMLVMGASMGSFYVVAMTMMGRRYRGADLIGVNVSFGFIWGVGGAVGPALSGLAMNSFGPDGMPGVGVLFCAFFVVICLRGEPQPAPVAGGDASIQK
jgi:MFS family permease